VIAFFTGLPVFPETARIEGFSDDPLAFVYLELLTA
jgi:hypothetical protein